MPTFNSATYGHPDWRQPAQSVSAAVLNAEMRFAEVEYKFLGTRPRETSCSWSDAKRHDHLPRALGGISEGIGGTGVTLTQSETRCSTIDTA